MLSTGSPCSTSSDGEINDSSTDINNGNRTNKWSTYNSWSITKFSNLIGSVRAYLSRNWRAITWCPFTGILISTTPNWIGWHLRHSRVNDMHLDGVFLAVFLLFANQIEYNFNFFTQKGIQRLFILEFCSDFLAFCYSCA